MSIADQALRLLLALYAAIELERLGQPLARFEGVRFALEHNVLHAEFRIAAHCRCDLLHRPCQGIGEETRFLCLEIGEPEADERRDTKRRRVASDLAARGFDFAEPLGHCFGFAHIAGVPEVGILCGQLEHARAFASHHQRWSF